MSHYQKPNNSSKKPHRLSLPLKLVILCIPLVIVAGVCVLYRINNRPLQFDIPTPILPPDNAYDDFIKAGKMAHKMRHKSPYWMDGKPEEKETLANFAACSNEAPPILAAMRLGLNKPCQSPPVRSFQTTLPEQYTFRQLASTISAVATYQERTRHPRQAMETRLDGMEMGVMIPHGGNMIHSRTGIYCESTAGSDCERLFPLLSPRELAHVAERLDKIVAKRTPLAENMLEEGYSDTAGIIELLNKTRFKDLPGVLISCSDCSPLTWQDVKPEAAAVIGLFSLSNKADMLRQNLDYYKKTAEEMRGPYTGQSAVPVPQHLLARFTGLDHYIYAQRDAVRMETVENILRIEVALYRYKAAHGRFPTTLVDLTPTYLKSVPDDPFGGASNIPLHYQVKADGRSFLLYSLGPDMKDDGGQPQKRPGGDPGDMVAGYLWYKAPPETRSSGATPAPSVPSRPGYAD